jgi:hypothetical protein
MQRSGTLSVLLLSATTLYASTCAATAPAPPKQAAAPTTTVAAFAATHERIRSRLPPEDRVVLDRLSAQVRAMLPRPAHLPQDAQRIIATVIKDLSAEELGALTRYVTGSLSSTASSSASGDSGSAALMQATQQMQETQMSFNLQYLMLQMQMQNEDRQFTMVSNIMKSKRDTVKNSIANIR